MRVRQILIAADLVWDETQWDLATVMENLPTFVACALDDPNERAERNETGPYWVMNPTTYFQISELDQDREESQGAFSGEYHRGYALEVGQVLEGWEVWGVLIAPRRPDQLARNWCGVVQARGTTRAQAVAAARSEIDRRVAEGHLPDIDPDNWQVETGPLVLEES